MNDRTRKQLLKLVADNYKTIVEDFSASRDKPLWPNVAKTITEQCELLSGVKPSDQQNLKVLDAGCGNGRLLSALPEDVNYCGVDNCAELIAIARAKHPDRRFETIDILSLNYLNELNFDLVASIAVLQHLPGIAARTEALLQLKSKLAPGGRLIITAWNLWADKKGRRLLIKFGLLKLLHKHDMDCGDIIFPWQNSSQPGADRYYHAFTKRELKRLIKAAGLKLKSLKKDKFNYCLVAEK